MSASTSKHLSHPEVPAGLFFAIFPDPQAGARIAQVARQLGRQYGLRGRPHLTTRFHISLQNLSAYDDLPERVLVKAGNAAACVSMMRPFAVRFDHVASFSGREGHYPLVLRGDDGVVGLTMLHRSLGMAMRRAGLKARLDCTPHITLLYDDQRVEEQPVEPICWTVRALVLVLSLSGRTKYVFLGQWPLRG